MNHETRQYVDILYVGESTEIQRAKTTLAATNIQFVFENHWDCIHEHRLEVSFEGDRALLLKYFVHIIKAGLAPLSFLVQMYLRGDKEEFEILKKAVEEAKA